MARGGNTWQCLFPKTIAFSSFFLSITKHTISRAKVAQINVPQFPPIVSPRTKTRRRTVIRFIKCDSSFVSTFRFYLLHLASFTAVNFVFARKGSGLASLGNRGSLCLRVGEMGLHRRFQHNSTCFRGIFMSPYSLVVPCDNKLDERKLFLETIGFSSHMSSCSIPIQGELVHN
ncbi:hypothetical protein CEXT_281771 [Caerostris extrusa]|uniref:Uncharacterized protein n=1 Tax=Caerostris extrusa TaxID=172846 RepID=A0AAV4XNG3_CAEEX|nr:hypothetical protein CEXT_281771 [Caerostris extrusa]